MSTCYLCGNDKYLKNNTCETIATLITECVEYDTNDDCIKCSSDYQLIDNECILIENCDTISNNLCI